MLGCSTQSSWQGFLAVAFVEIIGEGLEFVTWLDVGRPGPRPALLALLVMLTGIALLVHWRQGDGHDHAGTASPPFNLVHELSQVLTMTSQILREGDLFLSPDNILYRAEQTRDRVAPAVRCEGICCRRTRSCSGR